MGIKVIHLGFNASTQYGLTFLFVAPVACQAMLSSALLGARIGVLGLTSTSFLYAIHQTKPLEIITVAWVAGALCAYFVHPLKRRGDVLHVMVLLGLYLSSVAVWFALFPFISWSALFEAMLWAGVTSVLTVAFFELGLLVMEKAFGIMGEWSLLELCSPTHPLLHLLCLKAPGTYAHSVMVGNLAENAAREIGANPVLCRAMAYYHDIGKMIRPQYFAENQLGYNPHDQLAPRLSALILLAHVRDGIQLARQHKLPQPIIDVIAQHHGTTLIKSFYRRACELYGDPQKDLEKFFRYPGPKPQSVESAILHLADTVEAASRSLEDRSKEALSTLVENVIQEGVVAGQLEESSLNLSDLEKIRESFVTSLWAIRHERVKYPDIEEQEDSQKATYRYYERNRRKHRREAAVRGPRGVA
jgi:hypothetical protein